MFSEHIVLLVVGDEYFKSILVLKILSILPFVIFVSNLAGVQIMLNLNYVKKYLYIYIYAGMFSILLTLILVPLYYEIGTAITVVATELLVSIMMIKFLSKQIILEELFGL